MKSYIVYKIEDGAFVEIDRARNRNKAEKIIADNCDNEDFLLLRTDVYYGLQGNYLFGVAVYLLGDKICSFKRMPTIEYLEELRETLPVVYETSGRVYHLPSVNLTTPRAMEITGGWFHCSVVEDKPIKMAIVYRDVDRLTPKQRPPINKKASSQFGKTIYGNVIYLNENYI